MESTTDLFEYQFILYFGFPAKPPIRRIMETLQDDMVNVTRFERSSVKVSIVMEGSGHQKFIENEILSYCHDRNWNIEKVKLFSRKFTKHGVWTK